MSWFHFVSIFAAPTVVHTGLNHRLIARKNMVQIRKLALKVTAFAIPGKTNYHLDANGPCESQFGRRL